MYVTTQHDLTFNLNFHLNINNKMQNACVFKGMANTKIISHFYKKLNEFFLMNAGLCPHSSLNTK